MANIIDYLKWRGDVPLEIAPFNPVDGLIIAQFSYFPYEDVDSSFTGTASYKLGDLSKKLYDADLSYYSNSPRKSDLSFMSTLPKCPRFSEMIVSEYMNNVDIEEGIQFSAITVFSEDNFINVVFRGTDGSIIGWKEDFRLSYSEAIPAQIAAKNYLKRIAKTYKGPIRVIGHSKGGNLALYAVAHSPKYIQKRVKIIYANEAPGFSSAEIKYPGYNLIEDRVKFYVPNSSFIGMLLLNNMTYQVVKSDSFSVAQHNAYSWQVKKNGFVKSKLDRSSVLVKNALEKCYLSLSEEDLKTSVETLFDVILSSKAETLGDLTKGTILKLFKMISTSTRLDKETKKILRQVVLELFSSTASSIKEDGLFKKKKTDKPQLKQA